MPLANTIRLSDQLGVIRSVDYNSTFNRPTAIACDPPPHHYPQWPPVDLDSGL